MNRDEVIMNELIKLASKAMENDEVPVASLIVLNDKIIGTGINCKEKIKDSTAHAEILAIKEACHTLGRWRLDECIIYVNLEPCTMCMGAILEARIKKLVFGSYNYKTGAISSNRRIANLQNEENALEIVSGVLSEKCKELMQEFFKNKR